MPWLKSEHLHTHRPGRHKVIKLFSCSTDQLSTKFQLLIKAEMQGHVAQLVTCLATDACLTVDPGMASLIPSRSHTFMEIDNEIISMVILLLNHSRRVVVIYKQKYVYRVLVNSLFKLAQEKVW